VLFLFEAQEVDHQLDALLLAGGQALGRVGAVDRVEAGLLEVGDELRELGVVLG